MSRAHRPSPCCNRRSNCIRIDLERDVMLAACAICGKEFLSRLDPAAERARQEPTPAQRSAFTRRRNQAIARAAFLVERLPERKQECVEAHAKVVRLARAIVALPVEPCRPTIDAAQELGHAANDLWSKLHWLVQWTEELGGLKGGTAPAKTIHDDLANVIDFGQRRGETGRDP